MKSFPSQFFGPVLIALCTASFFTGSPAHAADGKKWDGRKYPFKLLDPTKTNSESNPFIIDTAGKLAYFGELAKAEVDMEAFGKKNGLKGLHHAFKDNYVKLTSDLDMNGSQYEFIAIKGSAVNFDGGGHVLSNLRISDKTTPPYIDADQGDAEITLALFEDVESVKNLGIGKGSSITYSSLSKLTLKVFVAGIAAHAYKIDNCFSDAVITVKGNGETSIGGIANSCTYLTNSYNRGAIVFEGKVINSRAKNRGKNAAPSWFKIGGVCIEISKTVSATNGTFSGCYNTGSITVRASADDASIGGVAADSGNSMCTDLYNAGAIRVAAIGDIKRASIGGVLARNWTYPSNPKVKTEGYVDSGYIFNKGSIDVSIITGQNINVGGVGGGLYDPHPSINCSSAEFGGVYGFINAYNIASVSVSSTGKAELFVGGIAGGGAMIINSYNTGKISGSSGAGGTLNLGGLGGGAVYVQNCYNIGPVSGKGPGANNVGGVIGLADTVWGESDREWFTSLNAFWLKQTVSGGVNSDIRYGKGSYYYLKKSDIKKDAVGKTLELLDKSDPNIMVEDSHAGFVYSFDSATSSVMKRSDDDPGKRSGLNGTLLFHLNEMVEDKINRVYRRWILDKSNGGYPVLSSTPTVFPRNSAKPDAVAAKQIAGTYAAVHKNWHDNVIFNSDGTFKRMTGGDGGTWSFDGKRLIIRWTKWTPEILSLKVPGSFSCNAYNFTLVRPDTSVKDHVTKDTSEVANSPSINNPEASKLKMIAGTYYAQHKDWTGTIIINADGTFKRTGTDDGGTCTFDGRTLILKWNKSMTDTLQTSATGFYCPAYKFTLRLIK
ncbi:MAG TPA: hypothetical protein VF857_09860 [Spirochaetota bacterium]